jgi:6-phosphogluconolactonase (cycloisomerase 2 family)
MVRNRNGARGLGVASLFVAAIVAGSWWTFTVRPQQSELQVAERGAGRNPSGLPQLVGVEQLPVMDGPMCEFVPVSASAEMSALFQMGTTAGDGRPTSADREPLRVIRDTYPTYSAVAVDFNNNEVFLQDENLFGIKVFNRLDNTPPSAAFTEPKRSIQGLETKLEFNCGLYVDPKSGDIYSVANDTVDTLVIFPRDAEGNVKPKREITTPHGTFGIAVDEDRQELFLTVQHEQAVVVYHKMAEGDDPILRRLEGPKTRLADPHGIALDPENGLMFVSNHGSYNERQKVGTGKFYPPSITVYRIDAQGDVAPLRVIEGPKTRLNWPATMAYDTEKDELFVANDADDSLLVFGANDSGDVAPRRVVKGPRTGIKNPTGVYIDPKNREVWVANMGRHAATVYRMDANGDAPPVRTIRSAPADKPSLAIGNPGGVAYDSKREEILVPN